jgi:hypothetical protein
MLKNANQIDYRIPLAPDLYYSEWISWPDWLGTKRIANRKREWDTYENCIKRIKGYKIKSETEWRRFAKSSKRPIDIPSNPSSVFKKMWKGWNYWLGTENISHKKIEIRSYEKAREFAQKLNLKNENQWYIYCKSGKKPSDIPRNVSKRYLNKGWISWDDFLGKK